MSKALETILIIGGIGVVAYFAWTQCWFNICNGQLDLSSEEFNAILPGLFTGGPAISQQDSQKVADAIESGKMTASDFNKLPTIAQNPSTSNYRSTSINTNPNARQNAVKAVNQQIKATPAAVKQFADSAQARLNAQCKGMPKTGMCAKAQYAAPMMSMFAETIHGSNRISV